MTDLSRTLDLSKALNDALEYREISYAELAKMSGKTRQSVYMSIGNNPKQGMSLSTFACFANSIGFDIMLVEKDSRDVFRQLDDGKRRITNLWQVTYGDDVMTFAGEKPSSAIAWLVHNHADEIDVSTSIHVEKIGIIVQDDETVHEIKLGNDSVMM